MQLSRLCIQSVRNLKEASLSFHPRFNFIIGDNGSGKTSLLEAIYLLALGRSFRSRQVHSLITEGAPTLTCFGEILHRDDLKTTLGIEKSREGEVRCKIQGEICSRLSEFASILPVQLITPETFRLLMAGAEERRRFLDWGVFHVEPSFATLCQTYHRALKQRNAALKQSYHSEEMKQWEHPLITTGETISHCRERYLSELMPFIQSVCAAWLPDIPLEIEYFSGWKESSLDEAIRLSRTKDSYSGFTSVGPHRGELKMYVHGRGPASQVLSRGQQKLLIFALYGAQAQQLMQQLGKRSLFLIDDLASELDTMNRKRVIEALWEQGYQVFCTATEAVEGSYGLEASMSAMFHVEHGKIS